MKRSSPHTLGVLVALSCPACDLASRSLGEFVEPRPQRGELDLDDTDGLSHLTVPSNDHIMAVVPLGDLDRDGYDDWAAVDSSIWKSGRARLIYGREGGYPPEANLDSIADAVFTIESSSRDHSWWLDIRALGDLDADGHTDIAIAVDEVGSDYIDNFARTSSVHILWGAEQRLQGAVEISSLPLAASTNGDVSRRGVRLHGAGDMNGDGADDVVLLSDSARLFEGPRTRDAALDAEHARPILDGESASAVLAGSDLDHDGFDDLVLTGDDPEGWDVTVVFGGPSAELDVSLASPGPRFTSALRMGTDVGDVNGDGATDLLVDTAGVLRIFAGPLARAQRTIALGHDERPGRYLLDVAVVGDIDGDGVEDVAATHEEEPVYDHIMSLYFGGAELASNLAAGATVVAFSSARLEYATAESTLVQQIVTTPLGGRLGDVNGDGFDDWAAVVRPTGCSGCGLPTAVHLIYGASDE